MRHKYFEGTITYAIKYESHNEAISTKYLEEVYGSKMVLFYKNGNYKKQYFDPDGFLLSERFLSTQNNTSYKRQVLNDTVYWIDHTKVDYQTTFKRIQDSIILGHPVIGIETNTILSPNKAPLMAKFYYSKEHPVNPNWYAQFKEMRYAEIIKVGKGIQLLYIYKWGDWDKTVTATAIQTRPILQSEIRFSLSTDIPLKEL